MKTLDKIRCLAVAEIDKQSFAVTRQFLRVHEICRDIGQFPLHIEMNSNKVWMVYFKVVNEEYTFCIPLKIKGISHEMGLPFMEAFSTVSLHVFSKRSLPSIISQVFGIDCHESNSKGELNSITNKIYTENVWTLKILKGKPSDLRSKLKYLIQLLNPKRKQIVDFMGKKGNSGMLSIYYAGYKDQMWGVQLEREAIGFFNDLNLELDIDIHASGPDLPN